MLSLKNGHSFDSGFCFIENYSFITTQGQKKNQTTTNNVNGIVIKNSHLPEAPLSKNHEKVEICQLYPVQIVGWHA